MKLLRKMGYGLLGAAAGLALVGTARAADPGVTDTEVTIGLFAPLSGPLVSYGVDPLNAAKMWYDDINAKGGIAGRKIKLVIEDTQCKPDVFVSVVKKLITVDHVFMLHGGSCTASIAAAEDYINREKVPMVMLNAAGDNAVFPPTRYVFGSFQGTQRSYGAALAHFAVDRLKAKRVAIIVHDDDYGGAMAAAAKAVLEANKVDVVDMERISPKISDVTAPMLKIRAAKPDVIISGGYPAPAVLIAQKYAEYGMTSIPLLQGSQGIPTPSTFAKNVANPEALKNFYYTRAFTDIGNPAIEKKYTDMYKAHYPGKEPGPFMITGLPSAMAVEAALRKVGRNLTREAFVAAMESLDFQPDAMAGPIAFGPHRRDALRSIFLVKFNGETQTQVPGTYTWDGK